MIEFNIHKVLQPNFLAKYWASIEKGGPDDCWPWLGYLTRGYGKIETDRQNYYVHRLAFFYAKGYVNPKLLVCHTCDFRACCNERHLFHGTQLDNRLDCDNKNRRGPWFLKIEEVNLLRWLAAGGISRKELAQFFGIGFSTVYRAINQTTHPPKGQNNQQKGEAQ